MAKSSQEFIVAEPFGLKNWQPVCQRVLLDGAGSRMVSSAARPVGLSYDRENLVARGIKSLKRRNGEFWGPEEDNSQAVWQRSPFSGPAELTDLLHDEIPLDAAHAIQEELAVEMIHLVLKGARQQLLALDGPLDAVAVDTLEDHP